MPAPVADGVFVRQDAAVWLAALDEAFARAKGVIDLAAVAALSVDGTSGTIIGVDQHGRPIAPARMYNEASARDEALMIAAVAPPETAAHGASSALGRAVRLMNDEMSAARIIHQADFIAGQFSGNFDVTDENNALKTGYDPVNASGQSGSARRACRFRCCRAWFRRARKSAMSPLRRRIVSGSSPAA